MYRIANNSAPEYLQSLFKYRLPGNTPHLRSMSTKHYKTPKPNKELFLKKVSNTLELCSGIVFQLRLEMPTLFPVSKPSISSGFRDAAKINKFL